MKLLFLAFFIVSNLFALDLQKPKTYQGSEDISGWYMSEKLDGIRGVWDGENLTTRKGHKIYAPKWFIEKLPPFKLDGELWTTQNDFENIQSIVMDKKPSKQWTQITYNIFEIPDAKGDFSQRLAKLQIWLDKNPKSNQVIKIIPQIICKDENHLQSYLSQIIQLKGEGVIIKDSTLPYHTGRSPHILKVKKAADMEGKVIDINYRDSSTVMKSLVLKLSNGSIFTLGNGFIKEQRVNHPKIGDIITFKYYGLTKKGKPKFASFLHIRKD